MEPLFSHSTFECSDPVVGPRSVLAARRGSPSARLELFDRTASSRESLEAFIKARFQLSYGASPTDFCSNLLGVRDSNGMWKGAVGYTVAHAQPLFLEQYLDEPVERALSRALGGAVERKRVVEIGNLASVEPGMTRHLIGALASHFHVNGYRWAVFTATRELRNSFRRLRLAPVELANADPARLRSGGAAWGNYYAHAPVVMGGAIAAGLNVSRR